MAKKKKVRGRPPPVDYDCLDDNDLTPLMQAARMGDINEIILRLGDCLDPDDRDLQGRTALSHAAELGNADVVDLLLVWDGVDPNSKDQKGWTPLHWFIGSLEAPNYSAFASSRSYPVAKLLLKCEKVVPYIKDNKGRTALSHAAERGQMDLVELLAKQGSIDADFPDCDGRTPLSLAAEGGHYRVAELLLKRYGVGSSSRDDVGRTPLSWAVMCSASTEDLWQLKDPISVVKLLLSCRDVDPESRDKEGRTPLSWAVGNSQLPNDVILKVINLLLQQSGVNPASRDIYDHTPFSRAAECGQETALKRLLKCGINPDCKDTDGRTPLSQAAAHGHESVVQLLLTQGSVHADSKDNFDRTPLWWAAKASHRAIVNSLLARVDVDPESMDKDGRTPLLCALENGHEGITRGFIEKDKIKATLHVLAKKGNLAPLQLFFEYAGRSEHGYNAKDIHGRTPLHTAAESGHARVVKELILRGADVNCEDINGTSPLLAALRRKQRDVVHMLLEHSAQATSIRLSEWLNADAQNTRDVIFELSQVSSTKQSVQFVNERRPRMASELGAHRRVLVFTRYPTWSDCLTCNPRKYLQLDRSRIFHDIQFYKNHDSVVIVATFPTENDVEKQDQATTLSWGEHGIAWTIVPPQEQKLESLWESRDHFSTLPYSWIPSDWAELFNLLIQETRKSWLKFCDSASERLSRRRDDQLCAKGSSIRMINRLAEDALEWSKLRKVLNGQVQAAKTFVEEYCRKYDQHKDLKVAQTAINLFAADVNAQIDQLEQTVKELLQIEFAWVSINEAHRSTSIATSLKRLSWITFIFLPAMFASSLFGMNVDILEHNPDWRWYLLFGGGFLILTFLVWLLFKYGCIEKLLEKPGAKRFQEWPETLTRRNQRFKTGDQTLPT